jgi:hypothetical protein
MSDEFIAIRIKSYKTKINHDLYRTKCNQLIFMLKGLIIKQIQMRNQGKSMLKDISSKNLWQSCDKPMVKCLLEKSIKDDDSSNDERGIFTLLVVKIELKPNCNCRKK